MAERYLGLDLRYRPRSFEDLIGEGQRMTAAALRRMVQLGTVPTGLLFSGPSGIGKTTTARVLASALDNADVIELDAASNAGVDDMRQLIGDLDYGAPGQTRVIILDEAHVLSKQAQNAILKTLEEPPPGVIFIFVTSEPEKISKTILTRLIEFPFRAVTPAEILDRLLTIRTAEGFAVEDTLLARIATEADGSVRAAVKSLELAVLAGATTVGAYADLRGDHDVAPEILLALTSGDAAWLFAVLDEKLRVVGRPTVILEQIEALLRDLLVLHARGTIAADGEALRVRRELTGLIPVAAIQAAYTVIWTQATQLRAGDALRNLEMTLVQIGRRFDGQVRPAARPVADDERLTDLAELA